MFYDLKWRNKNWGLEVSLFNKNLQGWFQGKAVLFHFREEKCEFLPFMSPYQVVTDPSTGRITHLVITRIL